MEAVALSGIFGLPFVDLYELLGRPSLDAVHEEICLALAKAPVDYTGGSHRSMAIMPAGREREALVDYGEVIAAMSDDAFATFRALADDPSSIAEDARALGQFGEERSHPLSRRQMLWLKVRFGVYFPWKAYVELIPNRTWGEKSAATGKHFTGRAKAFYPRTLALLQTLPFEQIGRANVMGLEAHDHGTVHRDCDPAAQETPDHFITLCPANNKQLYLWDDARQQKTAVNGQAVWFNDADYHGVDAAPYFQYSLRVDGYFRPEFLTRIREQAGRT